MNEPPSTRAGRLLFMPGRVLVTLLAIVLAVEFGQYIPEAFPGAHALGEVLRNLSYALIGAVIFHWLIVELPARRRRRSTYEFHRLTINNLLVFGAGLLAPYQEAAKKLGEQLDAWDQASLHRLATRIAKMQQVALAAGQLQPEQAFFGPSRTGLLHTVIDIALPRAMSDLAASASYLDDEVAHALSQFPRQDGMQALQVRVDSSGCITPELDVHIVWTLLEAARRLYAALLDTGAYDRSVFQGSWTPEGQGNVPLSDEVITRRAAN